MRQRILSVGMLAAVLATMLFGIPFAIVVGELQIANTRSQMERLADRAAVDITAAYASNRDPDGLLQPKRGYQIGLYDAGGMLSDGEGPGIADSVVQQAMRQAQVINGNNGGELVVAVPVDRGLTVVGAVRVSASRSQVYWREMPTYLTMAALALFGLAAAATFARWQAGRLAKPLEELARTSRELGDGDFSVRAATSGIQEIDSVASSLNSTANRLGELVSRRVDVAPVLGRGRWLPTMTFHVAKPPAPRRRARRPVGRVARPAAVSVQPSLFSAAVGGAR